MIIILLLVRNVSYCIVFFVFQDQENSDFLVAEILTAIFIVKSYRFFDFFSKVLN